MSIKIAALVLCLALAACGGRHGDERGAQVVARLGSVEVRQYSAVIAAETMVDGEADEATGIGRRRLALYLAGANATGTKLATTGPLAQLADAPGRWRIHVFLAAYDTVAALPRPDDPAVTLVPVPAETLAVLGFSGKPSQDAATRRTAELVAALEGSAWRPAGAPEAWFYEPGWLLRSRRGEVVIPVSPM